MLIFSASQHQKGEKEVKEAKSGRKTILWTDEEQPLVSHCL
jgi:hypothetical protein